MKSNIAYKYRIYPNKKQEKQIIDTFGCCRKVWNLMLSDKINYYEKYNKLLQTTPAQYKQDNPYLNDVDCMALCNVQLNLEKAYRNYFNKTAKFPKFKSKKSARQSYTTNTRAYIAGDKIKLPKIGYVKTVIHRKAPENYKFKSVTISLEPDGSYHASVLYEFNKTEYKKPDMLKASHIGIDYKSDGLFVDNNNNSADMPYYTKDSEKQLIKEQRKLSRMIEQNIQDYKTDKNKKYPIYKRPLENCKNIQKQKKKIAKIHRHIANQRKDFLHKKSTEIANQYDIISIEDLNMKAIANKSFGNGRKTNSNAYGMLINMLTYKQKDRNHMLIKIDRWFPSSQLCSCCGYKNPLLKNLNIRKWTCPGCNAYHDRDLNAAINIDTEGYRIALET